MEGATENAAVVQALVDNLLARGLDPAVPRLLIIDGSKALSRAIRRSFGRETAIQIDLARDAARNIVKAGEQAAQEVDRAGRSQGHVQA
jgi:putative transposase